MVNILSYLIQTLELKVLNYLGNLGLRNICYFIFEQPFIKMVSICVKRRKAAFKVQLFVCLCRMASKNSMQIFSACLNQSAFLAVDSEAILNLNLYSINPAYLKTFLVVSAKHHFCFKRYKINASWHFLHRWALKMCKGVKFLS